MATKRLKEDISDMRDDDAILVYHRGLHGEKIQITENSSMSFTLPWMNRAGSYCEGDLRITKDNKFYFCHDETFSNVVTDDCEFKDELISNLTSEQIDKMPLRERHDAPVGLHNLFETFIAMVKNLKGNVAFFPKMILDLKVPDDEKGEEEYCNQLMYDFYDFKDQMARELKCEDNDAMKYVHHLFPAFICYNRVTIDNLSRHSLFKNIGVEGDEIPDLPVMFMLLLQTDDIAEDDTIDYLERAYKEFENRTNVGFYLEYDDKFKEDVDDHDDDVPTTYIQKITNSYTIGIWNNANWDHNEQVEMIKFFKNKGVKYMNVDCSDFEVCIACGKLGVSGYGKS